MDNRDNKLWEGHRMMYPELREIFRESNKEKVSKPQLSDDAMARIEERIKYAMGFKRPILITYYRDYKINECIAFSFRILQGFLECNLEDGKKRKICYFDIIDVKIV